MKNLNTDKTIERIQQFFDKFTREVYFKAVDLKFEAAALKPELFRISENEFKLRDMIKAGEIAIIPAGFRCYTREHIRKKFKFNQPSMPFNSGFFSPSSIASIIRNPIINLKYPENTLTHSVCIKYENHMDSALGRGIKFQKSSYAEINSLATSRDLMGINKYLDHTYGYYTLDMQHNFVLAHYNWHVFATQSKSKGIYDPNINIENINKTLNRRIQRMFDLCNSSKYVFFVVGEFQKYNYMMIDDKYFDLHNFSELADTVKSAFNTKCFVTSFADIDSADKLFAMMN